MATALITGGHSGVGLACSRSLGERGVDLVLAGRSPERMRSAAEELRSAHGVKVTLLELDTSSLASVRAAAARTAELVEDGTIDSLAAVICNAGGRFDGEVQYSPEGYELTFATNCLGHFLLTELLVPLIAENGRVVFTGSGTHDPDTLDGRLVGAAVEPNAVALANDGKDGAKPLSAGKRYTTSKLCDIIYAHELGRRLERSGSSITAFSFDPGSMPDTGFLSDMPAAVQRVARSGAVRWLSRRAGVTTSTAAFSGASMAEIATTGDYPNGSYLQAKEGRLSVRRSSTMANDQRLADVLWEDSKRLVGLRPEEEAAALR